MTARPAIKEFTRLPIILGMSNGYSRIIGAHINEMRRSMGALVGIAQGILCDGHLSDEEIRALQKWFVDNPQLADAWPGDVIHDRVREVLDDGVITDVERNHLVNVLKDLIGAPDEDLQLAKLASSVTKLGCDTVVLEFPTKKFCVTGNFVHGDRSMVEAEIVKRRGVISKTVNKKLNYLVVGALGSGEWKNGSWGLKIDKAQKYKRDGCPIFIVMEQVWTASCKSCPV